VELGIDEGCLWASMAKHITDVLEGLTAAQHVNGQRVAQDVGTAADRVYTRLFQAVRWPAVDLATKRSMRGPLLAKVVQDRFTHRACQRQSPAPAGLGRKDGDRVARPIDVVETQRPNFTATQAVARKQKEHSVVATAVGLMPVHHGE
jgi:hypothetical protein